MKKWRKVAKMVKMPVTLILFVSVSLLIWPDKTVEAKTTENTTGMIAKTDAKSDAKKDGKQRQDKIRFLPPQEFEPKSPEDLPEPTKSPEDLPEPTKSDDLVCGPDSVGSLYLSLNYGDKVVIEPGTVYYESAAFGGSGKTGVIGNEYTQGAFYIGGFSVIDDVGTVMRNEVHSREEAMQSHYSQPDFFRVAYADLAWVAIFTDGFTTGDLGWLPRSAIKLEIPEDMSIVSDSDSDSVDPRDEIGAKDKCLSNDNSSAETGNEDDSNCDKQEERPGNKPQCPTPPELESGPEFKP